MSTEGLGMVRDVIGWGGGEGAANSTLLPSQHCGASFLLTSHPNSVLCFCKCKRC